MVNRPSNLTWLIATVLTGLVIGVVYFGGAKFIPLAGPLIAKHSFEVLLGAFGLLWLGTIVKGM